MAAEHAPALLRQMIDCAPDTDHSRQLAHDQLRALQAGSQELALPAAVAASKV